MEMLSHQWCERMLSVLRIIIGLLYMEHGLAKILDFPHQPNHAPYALLTLNPGLQGLLELVGGLLLALGLFTRTVAFVLAGNMASRRFSSREIVDCEHNSSPEGNRSPISWCTRREVSSRCSTAGNWRSSIASSSSISGWPVAASGASIDYARRHPPYRRAGPEQGGGRPCLPDSGWPIRSLVLPNPGGL